jgi:tetratricopeptide (TPR) repeat protein
MTCEEVERDELAEQYVLGRLPAHQQEAFEDHYFNCSRCLERVRIVEETRGELAAQAGRARPQWWRRGAAALATAAVLTLAVWAGRDALRDGDAPSPPFTAASRDVTLPAPATTALGAIDLPRYTPPRLRSTATEAQRVFREAMTSYTAGRCDTAIPPLQRALALDDTLTAARFYLAVCELHEGRIEPAAERLQRIAAAGESPYLEDAHFFLAKARIRQGDAAAARQQLSRVVALRGDRQEEAKRLLGELR